jgi:hypothetical protein
MVFGPLCFMSTSEAMRCLSVSFGGRLAGFLNGRTPVSHEVHLWPGGLKAAADDGSMSRCEPDLVVVLFFEDGTKAAIVCEMKWDAPDGAETMASQIKREREAVASGMGVSQAHQFTVSVTKNRLAHLPSGVAHAVTWSALEGEMSVGSRQGATDSPARIWCELCSAFLRESRQSTFQGFSDIPDLSAISSTPFVFFGEAA